MNDISAKIVSALKDVLKETYDLDAEAGILNIEIPKDPKMEDYSSTCAMRLAKTLHQNPKMIAETVAEGLKGKLPEAETIEIAGPGFINFRMKKSALASVINTILDAGDSYGRNNTGEGKRILVEWVSANPTGDLHPGHARGADDISLLRCLRDGVQEICDGKTEQDMPYRWFGGTDLQHPFRCEPDRSYQQEDHVICYRADNV